jgi:hypothetical protein
MTDQITYYAIVDEDSTPDQPVGVFRRVKGDSGQVDEVFSRHLKWEFSPLLYSAERGDTMYDFIPITEDDADRVVTRMRKAAGPAE